MAHTPHLAHEPAPRRFPAPHPRRQRRRAWPTAAVGSAHVTQPPRWRGGRADWVRGGGGARSCGRRPPPIRSGGWGRGLSLPPSAVGGGSGQPLIAGTTAVGGCQAANAAPPADHQPYRGPLVGSCGPLSFLRPIPFVVPVQRTGGPWGRVWFGIIALGVGCVAQLVVVSSRFHPDANTPPRPPAAVPSVLASCPGPCLA